MRLGGLPHHGASRLTYAPAVPTSAPRRLAFAVFLAGACLLALEGAARLAGDPDDTGSGTRDPKSGRRGVMLQGNAYLAWELAPGVHDENGHAVHVSEARMRGPLPGPKTGVRALAVGDSSVYGFGVGDDEIFTSVLAEQLGVEVLNAAVPGYSTAQALHLLRMRALAYEPDLLVVATLWSDNNFDTFVDRELLLDYAAWRGSEVGQLRERLGLSALFRWVDHGVRLAGHRVRHGRVTWMDDVSSGGGRRRVPIGDYAANLRTLCTLMAERGKGAVFLMLPNEEDIRPVLPNPPWRTYREVFARTAEACGAPLVSGPDLFRAAGGTLFLDKMHPNARGHRALGEGLAAALRAVGWPGRPLVARDPGAIAVPEDEWEGKGEALSEASRKSGPPPPPTAPAPGRGRTPASRF